MRVTSNIARILLGLLFRFGHSAPFETAIAREYMGVMLATPYGQRTLPSRTSPSVQKWHDTEGKIQRKNDLRCHSVSPSSKGVDQSAPGLVLCGRKGLGIASEEIL